MTYLLSVSLLALTLTPNVGPYAVAQSPAMRRGVTVELAATSNAVPMPDADNEDAWIVAVADDGSMYFGLDPVDAQGLAGAMKSRPRNREQKLYIKADARAPFASVLRVFDASRAAFFEAPVLLTSQAESPDGGTVTPPKGLEVWLTSPASSSGTIVVQLNSGQSSRELKVNNENILPAALHSTLEQLLQNRNQKIVLVKAAGAVPFAHVIHVIDVCRSLGAKVVLAPAEV